VIRSIDAGDAYFSSGNRCWRKQSYMRHCIVRSALRHGRPARWRTPSAQAPAWSGWEILQPNALPVDAVTAGTRSRTDRRGSRTSLRLR
jgi:hypothetical protein